MERPNTSEEKQYLLARKRVQKKKRFYNHLKSYVIVNIALGVMATMSGDPFFEFLPVPLFWGMGLAFHYIKVFGIPGTKILTPEWEDEEIEKEMDRIKGRRHHKPTSAAPPPSPPEEEESLELKELRKNYDDKDLV